MVAGCVVVGPDVVVVVAVTVVELPRIETFLQSVFQAKKQCVS